MFGRKAAHQKRALEQQVADLKATVQASRKECEAVAADRDVWKARAIRHSEDATREALTRRAETNRLRAQITHLAAKLDEALYEGLADRADVRPPVLAAAS